MYGFCKVWVCVCIGFVMCGCVYVRVFVVWLCVCTGFVRVDVCMFGFCNVWLCVCMVFVMCGCVYVWYL